MKGINFAHRFARQGPRASKFAFQHATRSTFRGQRRAYINGNVQQHRTFMGPGAILLTATLGSALVTAAVYPDDFKHAYKACERSGRVVAGLAACINEYVSPLTLFTYIIHF